jgi:hypothetical protein
MEDVVDGTWNICEMVTKALVAPECRFKDNIKVDVKNIILRRGQNECGSRWEPA